MGAQRKTTQVRDGYRIEYREKERDGVEETTESLRER